MRKLIMCLALIAVAGCSATPAATTHKAHHLSPVARAVAAECKAFRQVDNQITVATGQDSTPAMYAATLRDHLAGWTKSLESILKTPDRMGIPAGPNKARRFAVAVGQVALDLDNANLATLFAKPASRRIRLFRVQWNAATAALAEDALACA